MNEPLNEKTKKESSIKFVLIGDKKVGKTTLAERYINNKVIQQYIETIGIEIYPANTTINNKNFNIIIIDTPNNKQFRNIINNEYELANYAFIIFDITNRDSFNSVNDWINHCRSSGNENMDLILIGNKSDLDQNRTVTRKEAIKLASDNNMRYYEISANNRNDIENIFNDAVTNLFNKIHDDYDKLRATTQNNIQTPNVSIRLSNNYIGNKKCCCC